MLGGVQWQLTERTSRHSAETAAAAALTETETDVYARQLSAVGRCIASTHRQPAHVTLQRALRQARPTTITSHCPHYDLLGCVYDS